MHALSDESPLHAMYPCTKLWGEGEEDIHCKSTMSCSKELSNSLRILKHLAKFFQVRRLQSMLIFSILNKPCSFMVYYHLFGVFRS